MKQLVEYPLAAGGSIIIEVDEAPPETGVEQAALATTTVLKATQTLESAINHIKPAAGVILAQLQGLTERPEQIEVEFGLKLSTQVGAIIASGSTEANLVVRLRWTKEKSAT
jgi:hypothetical protein